MNTNCYRSKVCRCYYDDIKYYVKKQQQHKKKHTKKPPLMSKNLKFVAKPEVWTKKKRKLEIKRK